MPGTGVEGVFTPAIKQQLNECLSIFLALLAGTDSSTFAFLKGSDFPWATPLVHNRARHDLCVGQLSTAL